MRDSEAMHEHSDAQRLEDGPYASPDVLPSDHDARRQTVIEVDKMVDVHFRDDEALAWSSWPDAHERQHERVLEDLTRGTVSGDDFAEHAAHSSIAHPV